MKKQISFFIIIAVLIGIGIGVLTWNLLTPTLAEGVFYYQIDNTEANLFLITGKNKGTEIVSLSAREVDIGDYKPPRHSYISHDAKQMIYFKEIGEEPLGDVNLGEDVVVSRVIYKPILINLKTGKETEINQPMDSSSLVFSPDDTQIAWIKIVEGATFQDIEESGKKRELWISRADGQDAQLLADFDENVILLKRWSGDYIYFQGLWDATIRSLGRIDIKTKKIDYLVPRYCEKFLENCQNTEFSPSGRYFLYEIYTKTEDKEITELYLGDFENRESQEILTTDRISDRLWVNNEKEFFYTEQETIKKEGLKETIHLVDLKNQTDDVIYTGSYISQLTLSPDSNYLFFLEKENDEDFKLIRLNIKTKEAETILTDNYDHILLIK